MHINAAVIRGQVLLGLISFQWILSLKELPSLSIITQENKLPEHELRMHSNHSTAPAEPEILTLWPFINLLALDLSTLCLGHPHFQVFYPQAPTATVCRAGLLCFLSREARSQLSTVSQMVFLPFFLGFLAWKVGLGR